MKDKLADLIPWLEKLQESLAKVNPDDDGEEVQRRSHLAKFVPCFGSLAPPQQSHLQVTGRHRNPIAGVVGEGEDRSGAR